MPRNSDRNKKDGPTKRMDRNQDGRPRGKEVKPIPRSNDAATIVPLPNAQKFRPMNTGQTERLRKMRRRDI